MVATPTKSAIYMRVSKDDGSQETDNQLLVLQEEVERAKPDEELVEIYLDRESGRKGCRERSDFDRMFQDTERCRFDLLRFWALDRFSREGIRKTIGYLQRLDHLGVRFKSHRTLPQHRQRADRPHRLGGHKLLRPVRGAKDL